MFCSYKLLVFNGKIGDAIMKALRISILYTTVPSRFGRNNCNIKYLTSRTTTIEDNSQYPKTKQTVNNLWENILPSVIVSNEIKTVHDWKNVKDKLLQTVPEVSPVSVDSTILNFCIRIENYQLANSYIEFLKLTNVKLNLATIGKCFKLFYLLNADKVVDKKEEEDIFKLYQKVRETYKVLDSITGENVILALSLTKYWQVILEVLNEIQISYPTSIQAYSVAIASAFKNKDCNQGWSLLEEMIEKNRMPFDIVYLSYIEYCKNSKEEFMKSLEVLFEFFRLNNIDCSSEVAAKLIETCQELKVSVTESSVTNRGLCFNCEQKLQKFILEEHDFKKLKGAIFDKIIVGKNVFYKTTPIEIERFRSFLRNMTKYDVVIDGLNVAYSIGTKQSTNTLSRMVITVVRHFFEQNKKVLVLGRTHMNNWPNWKQVTDHADTFLTQSLSQDDPYLLYCALHSGLNTIIVTKDLMRSHIFKLEDPHLKIMFSHWLNQNQYQVRYFDNRGKVFFRYPQPFLKTTQNNNNYWHVPYNKDNENKWLCIHNQ